MLNLAVVAGAVTPVEAEEEVLAAGAAAADWVEAVAALEEEAVDLAAA